MKFQVCGGLDVPDWILPEIITLSKLPSLTVKLFANEVIHRILENLFDYEKVVKLAADSSLGESDVKACIATLHFFVVNAAKYDLDDNILLRELQQLGLPKEHSESLCQPYNENKDLLKAKFLQQSLKLPPLVVDGWQTRVADSKMVLLNLNPIQKDDDIKKTEDSILICLTDEKLQILLHELKAARALMDEY